MIVLWRISDKIGIEEPLVFDEVFTSATGALEACNQENGIKRLVKITPICDESQFYNYNKHDHIDQYFWLNVCNTKK